MVGFDRFVVSMVESIWEMTTDSNPTRTINSTQTFENEVQMSGILLRGTFS